MSRQLFLNLPVADLRTSMRFFGRLGFTFDEKFTDESCACMTVSDQAWVMLLERARFADFTTRPVLPAGDATEAIICLSATSRADVDALADTALGHGARPAGDAMDHGFMYGRSFYDPDGHLWEVMWMSEQAIADGPREVQRTA